MDDMSQQSGPPPGSQPGNPTGNQTGNQTGTTEPPQSGPRVSRDQMRDVDRLRRSSSDRYVAGVAGGLGRHFDVDPTIIRVVLVVLALFGGAGVLVYGAVWLFVPEDGEPTAPIEVGTEARRIILIIAGIIALSVVFGTPFFGGWSHGFPVPLLVIGLIVVALFATRDQRRQSRRRPPPPWGSVPAPANAPEGTTMTVTDTRPEPSQPPPAWLPPTPPAYSPPPRPRRTGLVLFWPTLALIAIALGTLGIFDTSGAVTISAYAALAVAVVGVMLVVGAFVGRPGGLIALGLLASLGLLVTSVIGAATGSSFSNKDLSAVPMTSSAVAPAYRIQTGTIDVDLTQVSDLAALDGRKVDLRLNAGEITVLVPRGVNVHVDADIRYAGQINLGADERGGFGTSMDRTLVGSTAVGTPTLDLEIDARVGQITVQQQ
ncbi:MAG: PspC protein [Marmoricola sp.]|jgi:phage shock protein PspC (stress-responsive transcriptional regulator)|nr:PspC protein [Marmoricola sp.]